MRRLFVGVELDAGVAAAAGVLAAALRARAERLAPKSRISWIPEDRLHLTVRFIGDAADARAGAIHRVMEPALPFTPFTLHLAGAGAFPPSGRPRVLWVGATAGHDRLEQVEREVTRRLASVGVPPEERPYRPHLTLARVREAGGLGAGRLFEGITGTDLGQTRVGTITLFESRLSSQGAAYVPLLRTRLAPD